MKKNIKKIITAVTFTGMLFLSVPVYANVAPTVPTEITTDEQSTSNEDTVQENTNTEVTTTDATDVTTTEETTTTDDTTTEDTTTVDTTTDETTTEDTTATDEATADETATEETTATDETNTEETTTEVELDGIAPDSGLYVLDRLLENIQLSLTFDDVNKAALLTTISEERLAEANYLIEKANSGEEINEEEWNQLIDDVLNDYKVKLESALESVEEVAIDLSEEDKAALDEILVKLENVSLVDEEVVENDPELKEVTDRALLVSSVVSGLDQEKAQELRDAGLGLGQISQVFALAEATGSDVEEVATLFTEQKLGYGQVAKELGVNTSELAKNKVKEKKQKEEANTEEEVENTEETATEETDSEVTEENANTEEDSTTEDSDTEVTTDEDQNDTQADADVEVTTDDNGNKNEKSNSPQNEKVKNEKSSGNSSDKANDKGNKK